VKMTVKHWFNGLAAEFYDAGIQKLVTWYNKCWNLHGDYIEKWFKVCSNDVKYFLLIVFTYLFFNHQTTFTFWITYVFGQKGYVSNTAEVHWSQFALIWLTQHIKIHKTLKMCPEASLAQTAQSKHTAWGDSEEIKSLFSIWNV
jgi:hypothetical protein